MVIAVQNNLYINYFDMWIYEDDINTVLRHNISMNGKSQDAEADE